MALQGRKALVTGGSRGIGAAIVQALAKEGAEILINYTSDSSKSKSEDLVKEVQKLGGKAYIVQADCGSTGELTLIPEKVRLMRGADIGEKLVAKCKEIWGEKFVIHILVNNAGLSFSLPYARNGILTKTTGVSINEPLAESNIETYEKTMNINVRGPMLIMKAFLPFIKKGGGGRVILLSSVSAQMGFVRLSTCAVRIV